MSFCTSTTKEEAPKITEKAKPVTI